MSADLPHSKAKMRVPGSNNKQTFRTNEKQNKYTRKIIIKQRRKKTKEMPVPRAQDGSDLFFLRLKISAAAMIIALAFAHTKWPAIRKKTIIHKYIYRGRSEKCHTKKKSLCLYVGTYIYIQPGLKSWKSRGSGADIFVFTTHYTPSLAIRAGPLVSALADELSVCGMRTNDHTHTIQFPAAKRCCDRRNARNDLKEHLCAQMNHRPAVFVVYFSVYLVLWKI